jgi:hypothetical protein
MSVCYDIFPVNANNPMRPLIFVHEQFRDRRVIERRYDSWQQAIDSTRCQVSANCGRLQRSAFR